MRKKISITLVLLSFLFVGLAAGCGSNKNEGPSNQSANGGSPAGLPSGMPNIKTTDFVIKKVDSMPEIDGDPSDQQWDKAQWVSAGYTSLKGIYTDDEIAFLYKIDDPTMSIVSPDSWQYKDGKFIRFREIAKENGIDPIPYGTYDMVNMVWETSTFELEEGGCYNFCHEDEDGKSRHVVPPGSKADLWIFLNKHGYGPTMSNETGWPLGFLGAYQQGGEISFIENDPKNPFQVTGGTFNFIGWAEERIQTSFDNPEFAGTSKATETGTYCLDCHSTRFVESNSLQGKSGKMPYRRNAVSIQNMFATSPEYIKPNPKDYADAAVITDKDIEAGLAVKIADLSKEEIEKAWAKYEALNCLVPELILQEPSGNLAQTLVGAQWSDGYWTIEVKRARVTNNPNDIQFGDLTQKFNMATALTLSYGDEYKNGGWEWDESFIIKFD